jgi:hypothetical protein
MVGKDCVFSLLIPYFLDSSIQQSLGITDFLSPSGNTHVILLHRCHYRPNRLHMIIEPLLENVTMSSLIREPLSSHLCLHL